jgi:hypothetical protein
MSDARDQYIEAVRAVFRKHGLKCTFAYKPEDPFFGSVSWETGNTDAFGLRDAFWERVPLPDAFHRPERRNVLMSEAYLASYVAPIERWIVESLKAKETA